MIRALSLSALALAVALASPALASPTSLRDLRYERMIGQTTWYTCGPAAVATLLSLYFGLPVSEADALEVALAAMGEIAAVEESGVTALALKAVLEGHGIQTRGYRVTLEALADYFQRGGLPVILHVTRPQLHYVLAEGLVAGQLVLADPSFGRRLMPLVAVEQEKGFSGIILVTLPAPDQTDLASAEQRGTLAWARDRLARLLSLRDRIR